MSHGTNFKYRMTMMLLDGLLQLKNKKKKNKEEKNDFNPINVKIHVHKYIL